MEAQKALEPLANELKNIQERFREQAKDVIKDLFTEFFNKHPEVGLITWTQYTPYFNDGDECVFSICEPYFIDNEDVDKVNENYYNAYDYTYGTSKFDAKTVEGEFAEDIKAVQDFLYSNTGFLKDFLGDHLCVKVTKEGIVTEEYEHD